MRPSRLHTLILAVAFGGWLTSTTEASPITPPIDYSTSGTIDPGPVKFVGTSGSFLTPGTFSLGDFKVDALPSSASLTYTNTPFSVDVNFSTSSGSSELVVQGLLNGTITGNTASSLIATISNVAQQGSGTLPFPLNTFTLVAPQTLSPHDLNHGKTDLFAYVSYNPAGQTLNTPEPTTLALFGTVLAGLGVRRWRRNGGC